MTDFLLPGDLLLIILLPAKLEFSLCPLQMAVKLGKKNLIEISEETQENHGSLRSMVPFISCSFKPELTQLNSNQTLCGEWPIKVKQESGPKSSHGANLEKSLGNMELKTEQLMLEAMLVIIMILQLSEMLVWCSIKVQMVWIGSLLTQKFLLFTEVVVLKLGGNLILQEIYMESLEMKMEINNQDGAEEFLKLITMILEIGNLMKNNLIHILLNHQECSDTEMICIY